MSSIALVNSPVNPETLVPPTLRPYQADCVQHVTGAITRGHRRVYFSLPTGTGKSVILGRLARDFLPQGRVLVVAHLRELIAQLAGHMATWCGEEAVGVVMADQNQPDAEVAVASVQTLARGRLARILADLRPIVAIFIDEFHHSTGPSYRTVIEAVRAHSPSVTVIGCSATPFRSDTATGDLAELFPVCAFERRLDEMQQAGWLAPLAYRRVVVPLELRDIALKLSGGEKDYDRGTLSLAARDPEVLHLLVAGTTPHLGNRCTLAFCAGVQHAHDLATVYRTAGVSAVAVDGAMPDRERARILDDWRAGAIQVLCQDSLLGEGFDFPPLAALVLAAPTASLVRYLQRLGRGTRLSPDTSKSDCLVLEATAGEPDPRQFTLDAVQPLDDVDGERPGPGGPRNPVLYLLDPLAVGKWRWLQLADGVYVVPADRDTSVWLVRDQDQAGSGLYRAAITAMTPAGDISVRSLPGHSFDASLPLHQAQQVAGQWLRDNATIALAGRDAWWHDRPASQKQLNAVASWNPTRWRPDLTAGEASEIITASMLSRWMPIARAALWPAGNSEKAV